MHMPTSAGGTGTTLPTTILTNGDIVPIPMCTPVYSSASGSVKRAKADALSTSLVVGLVFDPSIDVALTGNVQTGDIITASTAQWDVVAGTVGGLAFDTVYYLSPTTAGRLTSVAPSAVGQVVAAVILAVSSSQALILTWSPVRL